MSKVIDMIKTVFTPNRWELGGKLVEREEKSGDRKAYVLTIERGDGSQFRRHVTNEVAKRAAEIELGAFVCLVGTLYKHGFVPEGETETREVLRYTVREIAEVEESEANVNRVRLGGVIGKDGELTILESERPKCPINLVNGSSGFVFNAYDQAARTAEKLKEGDVVVLTLRFFAVLADQEDPSKGWKTRFTVEQIDRVDDAQPDTDTDAEQAAA